MICRIILSTMFVRFENPINHDGLEDNETIHEG